MSNHQVIADRVEIESLRAERTDAVMTREFDPLAGTPHSAAPEVINAQGTRSSHKSPFPQENWSIS
ncbi:hypothetical protein [Nocardia sp. NPDC052112]|uniref:hypothetical protein n=1 Tax=Nocardia sp. NPDC052112 TaxID=3155646 RepID=UPI0034352B11